MNNGESLKNSCLISEFVRQKKIERNLAGETECVRGMRDFEESMLDLGVLDCILFPSESSKIFKCIQFCGDLQLKLK